MPVEIGKKYAPASAATGKAQHIPVLDGWRGIALLLVLSEHFPLIPSSLPFLHPLTETGEHGVAIFFVLSGYLITIRLLEEQDKTGGLDLRSFYIRRFFRLMPCAWTYLFLLAATSQLRPLEGLSCIFFFRNFVDFGSHVLTQHFWSLSIEEQFYLVWPGLLILLGPRQSRRFAIGAAMTLSTWRILTLHYYAHEPFGLGLGTQRHADALLLGCIVALSSNLRIRPIVHRFVFGAGALLLIGYLWFIHSIVPLSESVVIGFLIWSSTQASLASVAKVLSLPVLRWLGLISYSAYVWQQPIAQIRSTAAGAMLIKLAAVIAVASASYYFLERPLTRVGRSLSRRSPAATPDEPSYTISNP